MVFQLLWRHILLATILAAAFTEIGHSARADDAPQPPASALIVFDHNGTTTALRVTGERQLAILESYFPHYRQRPESAETGGWIAKYEVFFTMKDGQAYRVLVSANSRYWSMGRGDLELRGYFSDFVAALLKAKSPRGESR